MYMYMNRANQAQKQKPQSPTAVAEESPRAAIKENIYRDEAASASASAKSAPTSVLV
jgi:hypothetical protein